MPLSTDKARVESATEAAAPVVFAVDNVCFRYDGSVAALDGISTTISAGERIALLGANGCGKSTLIKLLDGLLFADSGSILAFGEPLSDSRLRESAFGRKFRTRVAFVFQNSDAQLFCSNVREEIAFGPLQMGLPVTEVERRIADVAAFAGITSLLERAPFRLSGGEKKKVAIAAALAINPDVILLDEPTTGLDPRSQRWLVDLLVNLRPAGKTIITATHDLSIVPEIADRTIVMGEDHRIAADGPSNAILRDLNLLLRVNLIHEHAHRHGNIIHSHPHFHDAEHQHEHGDSGHAL
jgi:cobalt/nickel transport system ATP-binding protein